MKHVTGRIGGAVAAVLGSSIIAFVVLRLLPGNPALLVAGPLAPDDSVAAIAESMGLNEPVYVQYWTYMSSFLTGDWGFSHTAAQPVVEAFASRAPASIELGLAASVVAIAGAVLLSLLAVYRRRPVTDAIVRLLAYLGQGTPPFWLAIMLIVVFSQRADLFPGPDGRLNPNRTPPPNVTGLYTVDGLLAGQLGTVADALWHLALPAMALGIGSLAYLVRLLRANLLEVSNELYIVMARAKGVSRWRAFRRHALPNAIFPALTASGLVFAQLVSGSVLVEQVFAWPGIGNLVVRSILEKDFAVVQAFIFLSAVLYVIVNLMIELVYRLIDPRVRRPVVVS